jgi:hypothetical protein
MEEYFRVKKDGERIYTIAKSIFTGQIKMHNVRNGKSVFINKDLLKRLNVK